MPELPEVETVRRTLGPMVGRRAVSVWTSGHRLRLGRKIPKAGIQKHLCGRTVEGLRRLGKYLLIDFSEASHSLLVHLGMSGRLRLISPDEMRVKHTHLILKLGHHREGLCDLRYSDPRRFGQVELVVRGAERTHPALAKLGRDPLVDGVDGVELYDQLHSRRAALKVLLLDQKVMAGVGNIYASEALFEARIRPTLPGTRLSRPRAEALATAISTVLDRALGRGGTSLRDFVNADGKKGENSHYLWVYDREGQACPRRGCPGRIRRTVIQQRATFHCPSCQRR